MADPEENKKAAMAFYDLMFNQDRPAEAIDRYAGGHYTQHNPHVADGKEAFIGYFERMAQQYPGKTGRVQAGRRRRRPRRAPLLSDLARRSRLRRIDIFRFDDKGKIVEPWDVLQVIPDTAAHDNGMF